MKPHRERIIDDVLTALADRAIQLVTKTNAATFTHSKVKETDISRLRESELGRDLTDIVLYIETDEVAKERAQQAITNVLTLLFKSPYMGDTPPPKEFYESDLGKLISQAYAKMYLNDLISPGEALKQLQVSRQMLSNYVESGQLIPVYLAGKTMFIGSQVEHLQQGRTQSSKR